MVAVHLVCAADTVTDGANRDALKEYDRISTRVCLYLVYPLCTPSLLVNQ